MKKMMFWTGAGVAAAVSGIYAYRAFSRNRGRIKQGLKNAENVTASTRSALESAEHAMHETRKMI